MQYSLRKKDFWLDELAYAGVLVGIGVCESPNAGVVVNESFWPNILIDDFEWFIRMALFDAKNEEESAEFLHSNLGSVSKLETFLILENRQGPFRRCFKLESESKPVVFLIDSSRNYWPFRPIKIQSLQTMTPLLITPRTEIIFRIHNHYL